jgi:hypothetical protein
VSEGLACTRSLLLRCRDTESSQHKKKKVLSLGILPLNSFRTSMSVYVSISGESGVFILFSGGGRVTYLPVQRCREPTNKPNLKIQNGLLGHIVKSRKPGRKGFKILFNLIMRATCVIHRLVKSFWRRWIRGHSRFAVERQDAIHRELSLFSIRYANLD